LKTSVVSFVKTILILIEISYNSASFSVFNKMSSGLILVGLGMAALGVGGRIALRTAPKAISNMENVLKSMPSQLDSKAWANSKYYKGGFEGKMTKREAALILGVSPNAPAKKISDSHKKIMLLNHPDRGGSPYLASKINEAKDFLSK